LLFGSSSAGPTVQVDPGSTLPKAAAFLSATHREPGHAADGRESSPRRREQRGPRAFIRRGGAGGIGEEGVGELAFLGPELVDALLDGALADELVDEDRLGGKEAAVVVLNLTIFLINLWVIVWTSAKSASASSRPTAPRRCGKWKKAT
jgi:hypothetical protein